MRNRFVTWAALAAGVLLLAADFSQAGPFGRRGRATNEQPPLDSSPYYGAPQIAVTQVKPDVALITVQGIPASAEIYFDGHKTKQEGTVRVYETPQLDPKQRSTYEIKAKWMENGREVVRTNTVEVRPGQQVVLNVTEPPIMTDTGRATRGGRGRLLGRRR